MRAVYRFPSLILLLLSFAATLPSPASANDVEKLRKALAGQPFKDLPGVKLPQKADDGPATVCDSSIGYESWEPVETRGAYIPRLTRRIYRCDVDNITIESTRRPDEVDWKKQKRYYKPWIDDGFDRTR